MIKRPVAIAAGLWERQRAQSGATDEPPHRGVRVRGGDLRRRRLAHQERHVVRRPDVLLAARDFQRLEGAQLRPSEPFAVHRAAIPNHNRRLAAALLGDVQTPRLDQIGEQVVTFFQGVSPEPLSYRVLDVHVVRLDARPTLENVEVKQRRARVFHRDETFDRRARHAFDGFYDASDGVPVAEFRRFGRDRLRLEAQAGRLLFRTRPLLVLGRGGQVYVDPDVRDSTSLLVGRVMRAHNPLGVAAEVPLFFFRRPRDDVARRRLHPIVVLL